MHIETATEADLPDLLALMRGYCDFYEAATPEEGLRGIALALIADPREGRQPIARDEGRARADRSLSRGRPRARREDPHLAHRARQPRRAGALRPRRGPARTVA